VIVKIFYRFAKIKKWKGFRVLAVDGSTLQLLGDHISLKGIFSFHQFGPKAEAGHWMSRISYLYDVFNGIVLDSQIRGYNCSEIRLCKQHLPYISKGDIVLFDRFYATFGLMFQLIGKGAHFVFRMKNNWWNCVDDFLHGGLDEQIINIELPEKQRSLLSKYPHLSHSIRVRLIKKTNRKGDIQVFCTSLLDNQSYTAKSIINLYKQRWGIEEAYKLIKSRLEVADFSGLTAWAIQQDFYAKTMLISLVNTLCNGIKPRKSKIHSKRKTKDKQSQPRIPIINRTYALYHLKEVIRLTAYSLEELEKWLFRIIKRVSNCVEYSRKNQSNKRKFNDRGKYSMIYKSI